jgi:copper chaperone
VTGVKSYEVSLEKQSAEVVTDSDALDYNTVLSTIKKTGKKVTGGEADGVEMPIEVPAA